MINKRGSRDYYRPPTPKPQITDNLSFTQHTQRDSYLGQEPEENEEVVYVYSKKIVSNQPKQSQPLNPYYVAQRPGEDEDEDEDYDDEDYDDEDEEDDEESEDDDSFEEEDDEDREEGRASRKGSSTQAAKKTSKPSTSYPSTRLPSKKK